MTLQRITPIQMVAPKGDDEAAVRTRLRILLQLAVTIGRRTGRLRSSYRPNEEHQSLAGDSQNTVPDNTMEVKEHGENQTVRPEVPCGEGHAV